MNVFLTLMRRELGTYFVSLTGYVIISAVALLCGLSFVVLISGMGSGAYQLPVTELFFSSPLFWFILLIANAVITMRLYAHEKYSGTFETLMTTPVRDITVVAAKFSAALLFYLVLWLPMLACLWIVQYYARQSGALQPGAVGGLYLGMALIGGMFLSLGCFASAITRNQTIAAIITLVLSVSVFALGYLARAAEAMSTWQAQVLTRFAFFDQMHDFARGIVDTKVVVLYVTVTFFFLFLTLRAVESRRWR
jgi:ABC-2 type transport system permease protein